GHRARSDPRAWPAVAPEHRDLGRVAAAAVGVGDRAAIRPLQRLVDHGRLLAPRARPPPRFDDQPNLGQPYLNHFAAAAEPDRWKGRALTDLPAQLRLALALAHHLPGGAIDPPTAPRPSLP